MTTVKTLRLRRNLTAEKVAKATGVPRPKIYCFENRRIPLSWRSIFRLARFYGVSPEEIAEEDGFAKILEVAFDEGKLSPQS